MTVFDVILIIILFFFAFAGFFFGLIHTFGALAGTIVGILVAGNYFVEFAQYVPFAGDNLAKVISFLVIFIIASRLVGLVFWLLDKLFKIIAFIPFLRTFNRLGGLLLGFVEGSIVLGIALVMITRFPFGDFLGPAIAGSQIAEYLLVVGNWLLPLLPDVVEQAQSIMEEFPPASDIQIPDIINIQVPSEINLPDVNVNIPDVNVEFPDSVSN